MDPLTLTVGYAIFRGINALINEKTPSAKEINMPQNSKPIRILVFGTAGTGKTSLCNALTGQSRKIGDGVLGVTFEHYNYQISNQNNTQYLITDTAGLHEQKNGTVNPGIALKNLISLLKDSKDGYNLLIHVFRIPRLTQLEKDNFDFFVKATCESKIPALLVATGCENRVPMSLWADENIPIIKDLGLDYNDVVCTSFATSDRPTFEEEYRKLREESKLAVFDAINRHALTEAVVLFDTENSLVVVLKRSWNWFCRWTGLNDLKIGINERLREMLKRFVAYEILSEKEAEELAENNLQQKNGK